MISLDVKFSDDPAFQHIGDSLRALAYVFVHHIDMWLKLYADLKFMMDGFADITASMFFNHLMKSSGTEELSVSMLNIIANTFMEAIKETPVLKRYADTKTDPVMGMWKFCHYFFVPVRLNDESIPQDVKIESLRKWLTTIFVIPFNAEYCSKYSSVVKKYTLISEGRDKLTQNAVVQFKDNIKVDWINKIIAEYYVGKATFTLEFVRLTMHVALLSSIDILKKYNPFVKEACAINPNYDGRWVPSFGDEMVNTQLKKINELTVMVKLKDN